MIPFAEGVWEVNDALYYACRETRSHSMLKCFRESPTLYHQMYVANVLAAPDSRAFATGRALHTAVLEPHKFRQMFVRAPDVNRRTNAGKEALAAFEAEHAGKTVLAEAEWVMVNNIYETLRGNELARDLLNGDGRNELAIRWVDTATDLKLRGKMDRFSQARLLIVDVKTTDDATPSEFARSVYNYGYHTQAAFYVDGVAKAFGLAREQVRFVFVACMKTPPYEIGFYELDDDTLALGRRSNAKALADLRECETTGYWVPAYSSNITKLRAPAWAFAK